MKNKKGINQRAKSPQSLNQFYKLTKHQSQRHTEPTIPKRGKTGGKKT
jgi:hypothetical protein